MPKDKHNSWEATYASTSRTVLRIMRFIDFIRTLYQNMLNNREDSLSSCASNSYAKELGPHHIWIVRQAVKIGLYTSPARETFITSSK